jgi:hypothetical protein
VSKTIIAETAQSLLGSWPILVMRGWLVKIRPVCREMSDDSNCPLNRYKITVFPTLKVAFATPVEPENTDDDVE